MSGLVSTGDGAHQLRVMALFDAVADGDVDVIEDVAPAISGAIELGPTDEFATGDRLRSTWFVVVEGQGHLVTRDETQPLAIGDVVGVYNTPLFGRQDAVIRPLGRLQLLEMDAAIAPEPSKGLRVQLPAG